MSDTRSATQPYHGQAQAVMRIGMPVCVLMALAALAGGIAVATDPDRRLLGIAAAVSGVLVSWGFAHLIRAKTRAFGSALREVAGDATPGRRLLEVNYGPVTTDGVPSLTVRFVDQRRYDLLSAAGTVFHAAVTVRPGWPVVLDVTDRVGAPLGTVERLAPHGRRGDACVALRRADGSTLATARIPGGIAAYRFLDGGGRQHAVGAGRPGGGLLSIAPGTDPLLAHLLLGWVLHAPLIAQPVISRQVGEL